MQEAFVLARENVYLGSCSKPMHSFHALSMISAQRAYYVDYNTRTGSRDHAISVARVVVVGSTARVDIAEVRGVADVR